MKQLKVTTYQAYIFWENIDKNLQNIELKLSGLREKTDLIVLPEMFNTGFTMNAAELAENMNGKTVTWMKRMAEKYGAVVTGSLMIAENGKFYNRMIWMRPDGTLEQYDKKHLFAFANEEKTFTAGNQIKTVELNDWKIRLAICYDLRFPVFLRNKDAEYDLLLIIASWPDKRSMHWRTLIQARAIENQSFVIGVNRVGHDGNETYHSGHSMCINPTGETVYYKPEDEDLYTFTINYDDLVEIRNYHPFLKDADDFELK